MGNIRDVFAKVGKFIVPLEKGEYQKFFSISFAFFLISLIYNILRTLKISMIVSASGAEIIPYVKVWGVLPSAFLFTYIVIKLSSRLKREHVFHILIGFFILYFSIFLFIIYPNRNSCELVSLSNSLQSLLPSAFNGIILMIRYWHFSLFYLFSELWSTIILSLLFWGFVNEISRVHQAKRFYGSFALSANIAAVFAGQITLSTCQMNSSQFFLTFCEDMWHQSVFLLLSVVIFSGIIVWFLFSYVSKVHEQEQIESDEKVRRLSLKKKERAGLLQSLNLVLKSRYLFYLSILVFGYNLVFNLIDVLWTDQLSQMFEGDQLGLAIYISRVTMMKGFLATILAIFVTTTVVTKLGWVYAAITTPVMIFLTSFLFFPLVLSQETGLEKYLLSLSPGATLLSITVFIGAVQSCLTRSLKYTMFDATKEMAFVPLDLNMKRQGKAVIDGVGSRIGKSCGSLVYQVLLPFFASISATVPYVAIIVFVVVLLWIYSVIGLNKEMKKLKGSEKI